MSLLDKLKKAVHPKANWKIRAARTLALAIAGVMSAPFFASELDGEPLSREDIDLYNDYYGDSVDYSSVQTYSSGVSDAYLNLMGAYAVAIGHTVFIRSGFNGGEDAQKELAYIKMHELAHSWQNENCYYPINAFKAQFQRAVGIVSGKGWDGHYMYTLEHDKDLLDYDIEQQASILADYFALQSGSDHAIFSGESIGMGELKQKMESVLANFLEDPNYIKDRCLALAL